MIREVKTIQVEQDLFITGISSWADNTPLGLEKISKMWGEVFTGQASIDLSQPTYAVYSNYQNKENPVMGEYLFTIGNSVTQPFEDAKPTIVKGTYRCYHIVAEDSGEAQQAIGQVWQEVWSDASFERTYQTDYELYTSPTEVFIYVGIK